MSDDTHRALTALVLAGQGAYAYTGPGSIAALSRLGWCTANGEITRAGEDAFADAHEERTRRRNATQTPPFPTQGANLRNPARG